MIWIVFSIMIGVAVAFAAVPLLGVSRAAPSDTNLRAQHYAAQLAEIEHDASNGAISRLEADALSNEAGRRLIAAGVTPGVLELEMQNPKPIAAIAIAAIIAISGVSLYVIKGRPDTPSVKRAISASPAATIGSSTQTEIGAVDAMIDGLKSRLLTTPEDADGWRMLGWSYFNLGRYKESADAYANTVRLHPENADFQSAYGEALVMSAAGFVTPAALKAFDAALAAGTDDPRARFFRALSLDQAGDPKAAIESWIELANSAAPDADWRDGLVQRIKERAGESGVDISGRIKGLERRRGGDWLPVGPTREEIQAAETMPADEQQAMIAGMVERLAARLRDNPNDAEGWIRLIKSRMVLGARDDAERDLRTALAAFEGSPELRSRVAEEAEKLGVAAD